MKKTFQLVMFSVLLAAALVLVNNLLNASGIGCTCFDDAEANDICDSICSTHGYCVNTVEADSWCIEKRCDTNFWSYCQDQTSYRRTVSYENCPTCPAG
ncbi:MAG TPA: hypothetical protein VK186_22360 [Candidatus Deferrimicrobium sp.]|nr:hypothetical protein [Candidatus Kapabacteria bacterium]HLP61600.1 hypothetical protein [Candidatus Deferrimicrobium sp.]